MTVPGPIPSNLSWSAIAEYTRRIAAEHGVHQKLPVDMRRLVDLLGGSVHVLDGPVALWVRGKGDFTVYVPVHTSTTQDRIAFAHAVGHYFLHYRATGYEAGDMFFGRACRGRPAVEANVFASALLMPREEFTAAWSKHRGEVWAVAGVFGVSPAAVRTRAQALNCDLAPGDVTR
ncbi:hypothetical protein ACT17_05965 [Mycolicibacterium conceptionense]|uniref:IrrE N-terminal-like domain-containing protein n=1 Tax=Mycolicibacterium conceptionense TaxID=451644 RepID=A0A0J8X2A7_9MYCO|nr:ImmA/IrrE family metallo-endopeptidase [Mycolicibacterium conceptionense]KMV19594.1 hypothetical protein ACT17_05965 [Mycolicibacterium conceptionense]